MLALAAHCSTIGAVVRPALKSLSAVQLCLKPKQGAYSAQMSSTAQHNTFEPLKIRRAIPFAAELICHCCNNSEGTSRF